MNLKTEILIVASLFATCFANGQTGGDKKESKLADTSKVNELLTLSKENLSSDLLKAIDYSKEAMDLSIKIDFKKGEALALKMIGIAHYYQGNNLEALNFYKQSLNVFSLIRDDNGVSNLQNNIGAIYMNQGDDAKALDYFLQSLQRAEKTGDKLRILTAMTNVGAVYSHNDSTLEKSLIYDLKALPLAKQLDDKQAIGTITVNIGSIYSLQGKDSIALIYLKQSLKAFGNSENSPASYNAIGKVYLNQKKYPQALSSHQQAYNIAKKLNGKLDVVQSLQGLANTNVELGENSKAIKYFKEAEVIADSIDASFELLKVDSSMAASYARLSDYKNATAYHIKYEYYKDLLYNNETDKKLANLQFDFDLQKKEGEITVLKKDNSYRELEIKKQRFAKNASVIGLVMVFILAFFIYRNYRIKAKSNKILDRKNVEIENLLLNILPAEVAKELQTTGKATSRHYENVSVLFTDFKGFTAIADKLSPEEVVEELNTCFMAFDNIVQKHNLEKIKTIGDSYMCAGGIPTFNKDHVCNMVKASLEMLVFMEKYNHERGMKRLPVWDIRIGVHVGPVVAGVVGTKKYAYDIWGSTVNIASRMESNGSPGLVNISAATYEQVKNDYACNYRGKIYAKNVGDIDMYFVSAEQIKYEKSQVIPRIEIPVGTKIQ